MSVPSLTNMSDTNRLVVKLISLNAYKVANSMH